MIFVTGGAGFIGQHLLQHLNTKGHPVISLDQQELTPQLLPADIIHYRGSTLEQSLLRQIFRDHPIESVIHLGMVSNTSEATKNLEAARQSILQGTQNLLEAMSESSISRIIFASTSMVYGNFSQHSISEEEACEPIEAYGTLKYQAEQMIQNWSDQGQGFYTIFRPISVYGPNDQKLRIVSKLLNRARQGLDLEVRGAETTLDFTYIKDVVQAIELMVTHGHLKNEVFNIARGQSRRLKELTQIIAQHFPRVSVQFNEADPNLPRRGAFIVEKAQRLLGFKAQVDLEEGVAEMVKELH